MEYPPEFSNEATAAVEAELISAVRLHDARKRRSNPGWSFPERQSLTACILSVFLVYAREAIKLGQSGVWGVDRVRQRALEGLRLITIELGYRRDYDHFIERGGCNLSVETQREFETTTRWYQFEDALLALALQRTTTGADSAPEEILPATNISGRPTAVLLILKNQLSRELISAEQALAEVVAIPDDTRYPIALRTIISTEIGRLTSPPPEMEEPAIGALRAMFEQPSPRVRREAMNILIDRILDPLEIKDLGKSEHSRDDRWFTRGSSGDSAIETQSGGGIPSERKVHMPGITQQMKFTENRHSLPFVPEEYKVDFRGLAHAAILAVTRESSVPMAQVDDWMNLLVQNGYSWQTMEQLVSASKAHLVDLHRQELAVGSSERTGRFDALATEFGELLTRVSKSGEFTQGPVSSQTDTPSVASVSGVPCDPRLWQRFSYGRTSKQSTFRESLIYSVVSLSIPKHRTNRDMVELIAKESRIPIESLPPDLNDPVFTRGQAIFGFAGDEFDRVAKNYEDMQWWLSDAGLNMAIVSPATPPSPLPTFDELLGLTVREDGMRSEAAPAIENIETTTECPPTTSASPELPANSTAASGGDGGLDFASETARTAAIDAYIKHWIKDSGVCTEASLARTARVDPADLSRWKKGLLPAGSDKKQRIEDALRNNERPTPPLPRRRSDA
jgi:hypothetical protein